MCDFENALPKEERSRKSGKASWVGNDGVTDVAGIKPGVVTAGVTGPTSQIPGLSQSADVNVPVERTSGRRVGIFETDSDYVKLAKSGGHKGEMTVMKNSPMSARVQLNTILNIFRLLVKNIQNFVEFSPGGVKGTFRNVLSGNLVKTSLIIRLH